MKSASPHKKRASAGYDTICNQLFPCHTCAPAGGTLLSKWPWKLRPSFSDVVVLVLLLHFWHSVHHLRLTSTEDGNLSGLPSALGLSPQVSHNPSLKSCIIDGVCHSSSHETHSNPKLEGIGVDVVPGKRQNAESVLESLVVGTPMLPDEEVATHIENSSTEVGSIPVSGVHKTEESGQFYTVGGTTGSILSSDGASNTEDMPSFNEWAKKRLEEQGKNGAKGQSSSLGGAAIKSSSTHKITHKSYSSGDCGAKIVSANPEAQSASSVLNGYMDEYMLNPCTAKIWLVIELCESIQADRIEIANFELFSSSPKEFTVYANDRYPTREWKNLGSFVAKDERTIQSFSLLHDSFGKYLKIEMTSHYGSEHFCPISLVRVYGTSEYEVLETDEHDTNHETHFNAVGEERLGNDAIEESKNLFGSAKEAVLSIMKKAAQALTRDKAERTENVDEPTRIFNFTPSNGDPNECVSLQRIPGFNLEDPVNLSGHQHLLNDRVMAMLHCKFESLQQTLRSLGGVNLFLRCPICSQYTSSLSLAVDFSHLGYGWCGYMYNMFGPVRFGALCYLSKMLWNNENRPVGTPSCSFTTDAASLGFGKSENLPGRSLEYSTMVLATASFVPPLVEALPSASSTGSAKSYVHFKGESMPVVISTPLVSSNVASIDAKIQPTRTLIYGSSMSTNDQIPRVIPSGSTVACPSIMDNDASCSRTNGDKVIIQSHPEGGSDTDAARKNKLESVESVTLLSAAVPVGDGKQASSLFLDNVQASLDPHLGSSYVDSLSFAVNTETSSSVIAPNVEIGSNDDVAGGETIENGPTTPQMAASATSGEKLLQPLAGMTSSQKESVFVRLTNRIKALELNMSLSGLYLEELSQRYRKQMEEMQRAFNKTVGALNDTARSAYERDVKHKEMISHLQMQVDNLTSTVNILLSQQEGLHTQVIGRHLFLMMLEVLVMGVVFLICARPNLSFQYGSRRNALVNTGVSRSRTLGGNGKKSTKRRNSVVGTVGHVVPQLTYHQRRPSEEALNISGNYMNLLIVEPTVPVLTDNPSVQTDLDLKRKKKTKNKKHVRNLYRSVSNTALPCTRKPPPHPIAQRQASTKLNSAGLLFGALSQRVEDLSSRKSRKSPERKDSGTSTSSSISTNDGSVAYRSADSCTLMNDKKKLHVKRSANGATSHGICSQLQLRTGGRDVMAQVSLFPQSELSPVIPQQCGGVDNGKGGFNIKKLFQKVYA